ncbi:hypothetical protein OAD85_01780 [Actinomycetota bacterium]|nr:hypothetical protein [Actinomycetota bacterium]
MKGWVIGLSVLAILLIFFILYLGMTAGRIDRLHRRIDVARLALDSHLLRRSGVTLELASSGYLDPASAVLISETAHTARLSTDLSSTQRDSAESELTAVLNAVLDVEAVQMIDDSLGGHEILEEFAASARRVELSRRFLNDAVRACVQLRKQRSARWFQLAGHTPVPQTREIHDHVVFSQRS